MTLLRKGSQGREVIALKSRLLELGYWPVLVRRTAVFDERTHSNVVWFQSTHFNKRGVPLMADGIVGPATRWALSNPDSSPRPHIADGDGDASVAAVCSVRGALVHVAREKVGVREEPLGSNRGPAVDQFIPRWRRFNPGPAWCAFFASWVDHKATSGYGLGRRHGSCHKMYSAALERQLGIPVQQMTPGDLFFLSDGQRMRHVGFCYRFGGGDGAFNTVEGNSGHQVALGLRKVSEIAAVVRLGPPLDPGAVSALQSLPLVNAVKASGQTR